MSKKKRPKSKRTPIQPKKNFPRGDSYWEDQLEGWLNRFEASTCDLPDLTPETAKTTKQHEHAIRVRRKYIVRKLRQIDTSNDADSASEEAWEMLYELVLITDAIEWLRISREYHGNRQDPVVIG